MLSKKNYFIHKVPIYVGMETIFFNKKKNLIKKLKMKNIY